MDTGRTDQFEKELNEVSFPGLSGMKCGSLLRYQFYSDQLIMVSSLKIIRSFARVLRASFTIGIDASKEVKYARSLFVFTNSYRGRSDYMEWFKYISEHVEKSGLIIPRNRRLYVKNCLFIPIFFRWLNRSSHIKDYKRRIVYLSMLYEAYIDYCYIKEFLSDKTKIVATVSDVHPIDSMIIQHANSLGIKTATFEHGLSGEGNDDGYLYSKSMFYLAQGEFSKRHALRLGIPEDRIKTLGNPKLILRKTTPNSLYDNRVDSLAVFFCGDEYYEDDLVLLDIVLKWNEKHNYRIYVKMHPDFGKENYHYDKWDKVEKIYNERIPAEELAKEVKISVTAGSSVFADFSSQLYPVAAYLGRYHIYDDVKYYTFKTSEELEIIVRELNNNKKLFLEKMIYNREDFSAKGNVADNYRDFFVSCY